MPRRLVLTAPDGAGIALDVCNRRLLRAGDRAGKAAASLGEGALTYAGAAELAALRDRLAGLCGSGGVRIVAMPARDGPTLEQTGVAVATLRQAWEIAPSAGTAAAIDPEAIFAQASDGALAAIRMGADGTTERIGPADRTEALSALLDGGEPEDLTGDSAPFALLLEGDPVRPALLLIAGERMRAAVALAPAGGAGAPLDALRARLAD
jgi:hypothetical protein